MSSPVALPEVAALVADDDEATRRLLVRSLAAVWPGLKIVQAVDGVEAWDSFLAHEPALCFLDVRMPGLTGIEVAQRIADRAQTVFLLAANDQALGGLTAGHALHLTKPLLPERVAEAVAHLQQHLAPEQQAALPSLQALLDRLASQLRRPAPLEVIEAGDGAQRCLLPVDDIVYFEAEARGTRAVSAQGETHIRTPLKELVARLDPLRFPQIHRFVVVNRRHILATRRSDDGSMVMSLREGQKTLPVARHFQAQFKDH